MAKSNCVSGDEHFELHTSTSYTIDEMGNNNNNNRMKTKYIYVNYHPKYVQTETTKKCVYSEKGKSKCKLEK